MSFSSSVRRLQGAPEHLSWGSVSEKGEARQVGRTLRAALRAGDLGPAGCAHALGKPSVRKGVRPLGAPHWDCEGTSTRPHWQPRRHGEGESLRTLCGPDVGCGWGHMSEALHGGQSHLSPLDTRHQSAHPQAGLGRRHPRQTVHPRHHPIRGWGVFRGFQPHWLDRDPPPPLGLSAQAPCPAPWKRPNGTSESIFIKHYVASYSAPRKKGTLPLVTTWMDLKGIVHVK